MSNINYRYAHDHQLKLVDVNSLSKEDKPFKQVFTCLACGRHLVPKLGSIRRKHFAHKEEVFCSRETYLHKLGKLIFAAEYKMCLTLGLPFYLNFTRNVVCNSLEQKHGLQCIIDEVEDKFDLTTVFKDIFEEKREGDFVPDLLLSARNGQEKIFIEIAVTHLSTIKKLHSNYRIIELTVTEETDLDLLKGHNLADSDRLKLYNFKFKDDIRNRCGGSCTHKGFCLSAIFNDGKCVLRPNMTLSHAQNYINKVKSDLQFAEIQKNQPDVRKEYFRLIAQAYNKGLKVKNCFICKYYAINEYRDFLMDDDGDKAIFCKFRKIKCTSNEAITCDYFRVNQEYVEALS